MKIKINQKKFLLTLLLVVLSSCSNLLYYPDKILYSNPQDSGISVTSLSINTSDNFKLHGWFLTKSKNKFQSKDFKGRNLILFFHGNAQNISSHYLNLSWILDHNTDVILYDYRGYGLSSGSPTPKGVYDDAEVIIKDTWSFFKKSGYEKFIVYGQSLGGAISLRAVQDFKEKNDIDLLCLDSTFFSYKDLAENKLKSSWPTYLLSPLGRLLLSDSFAPMDKFINLKTPILVIHGTNDKIVPFKFGQEIFSKIKHKKWFWVIKSGLHTDTFLRHDLKYRKDFLSLINEEIK